MVADYDPRYRAYSLDEIYFDLTTVVRRRAEEGSEESEEELADLILGEIRAKVSAATGGLTCSAGIANNFMLAKICADVNKPNGQFLLSRDRTEIMRFLSALPCRKVPGIGKVQEKVLSGFGVQTMGDLLHSLHKIYFVSTPAHRQFLLRASLGIEEGEGERPPEEPPEGAVTRKSLGVSRTFATIDKPAEIREKLLEICSMVAEDMASQGLRGQLVTLKLKTADFQCLSKCSTAMNFIQSSQDIYAIAEPLLDSLLPLKLRLLGVTMSKFENAFDQRNRDQPTLLKFLSPTKQPRQVMNVPESETTVFDSPAGQQSDRGEVIDLVDDNDDSDLRIPSNSGKVLCPVCNKEISSTNLAAVNAHIDSCLNPISTTKGKKRNVSSHEGAGQITKFFKVD